MNLKSSKTLITFMIAGYAFLYAPILILILFSFNSSKILTTWTGFSMRWYEELMHNETILHAAWLSIKIAFMTANIAVTIGTIAAIVMARVRQFKGSGFFNNIVTAPLVMPDVMTGLALLLLFVSLQQTIGWPKIRGPLTITIGHTTLAIAYVILIVRARLIEFDRSLEEAALDLGARPYKVFFQVTLPLIFPAIASGWFLAFTLSFDDVILASFLSGPGSSTLPMVIFSSVRFGVSPVVNALATIIVIFVAISVIITGISLYRRTLQKEKQRT
jgi:putrescine transport system permease protein